MGKQAHIAKASAEKSSEFVGTITLNMVIETLSEYGFLHVSARKQAVFSDYRALASSESLNLFYDRHDGNHRFQALILCHDDIAKEVLDTLPNGYCVVLSAGDEPMPELMDAKYCDRILMIRRNHSFYEYDAILSNLFRVILRWEIAMDHCVYSANLQNPFGELMKVSEQILCGFVGILDNGFNFIVHTSDPDCLESASLCNRAESIRCLDQDEIVNIRTNVLPYVTSRSAICDQKKDERHGFPGFHCPIFVDGVFVFHVMMICSSYGVPAGRDLFAKFVKRVEILGRNYWNKVVEVDAPWHRIINAIIDNTQVSSEYRDIQMNGLKLNNAKQYRLIVFPLDENETYQNNAALAESASMVNDGACYTTIRDNNVLVLCYSVTEDQTALCGKDLSASADKYIYSRFKRRGGMSQRFRSIDDLRYAYRQAIVALDYVDNIVTEAEMQEVTEPLAAVPFEFVLRYYLLRPDRDYELCASALSKGIMSELIKEDEAKGTNIVPLIVSFLQNGGNATRAAKQMHVHRNTVLYHVERIQKAYGINLSHHFTATQFLMDYCYFYAMKSD